MATFDLSILTTLKEKFTSLEDEIKEKKELIASHETQLSQIQDSIQQLESERLTSEMNKNAEQEELTKLEHLYTETIQQYKIVTETATQLIELFDR
jgi:chromosome segregation ATPase